MPAGTVDYRKETVEAFDESWSRQYREGDAAAVTHGSRQHYADLLRSLSSGFHRPIEVLDVGCGTGRYFHCLHEVRRLVGIDISPSMLEQARQPVNAQELQIGSLELLCGDIYSLDLSGRTFDLIYSIGVVGEYSPVNAVLLAKLRALLAPGGKLLLTAVDIHSRLQQPENQEADIGLGLRVLRKLFPAMPSVLQRACNRALATYYVTEAELRGLFEHAGFASFEITRYEHVSGWRGVHLDCVATKA